MGVPLLAAISHFTAHTTARRVSPPPKSRFLFTISSAISHFVFQSLCVCNSLLSRDTGSKGGREESVREGGTRGREKGVGRHRLAERSALLVSPAESSVSFCPSMLPPVVVPVFTADASATPQPPPHPTAIPTPAFHSAVGPFTRHSLTHCLSNLIGTACFLVASWMPPQLRFTRPVAWVIVFVFMCL